MSVIIVKRGGRIGRHVVDGVEQASGAPTSFINREPLPQPSWDEMIGHLGTALVKWAASGFKIAPPEVRAERYAICRACGYWKDDGNLGLGKCTHHKCGCTKAKFHLASERCPDDPPKWKAIES